MGAVGAGQGIAEILLERVIGRDQRREERHRDGHDHHHHAERAEAGAGGLPEHGPAAGALPPLGRRLRHGRRPLSDI